MIKTHQEDHTLWVSLNRPEAKNALSSEMIESLCQTLKQADWSSDIKVIVLSGEGDAFCAGGDVKEMKAKSGMFAGDSYELRKRYKFGIQQIPQTIEALETPLIAMVNGPAIGAGCDLACMCDLRVASDKAVFAETFANLGLVPGDGGTFFLQRLIGYGRAMDLFLTGRKVRGQEAYDLGLVQRLVPHETLQQETKKLCQEISQKSAQALGLTKRAMVHGYRNDLNGQLELLSSFQGISQRSQEHENLIKS